MAKKSFPILGRTLEISEERDMYVAYRKFTKMLSINVSQEFINLYNENVKNLEEALDKSLDIAVEVLRPRASMIVSFYLKGNFLDVTEEDVIKEILNHNLFRNAYMQIQNEYNEVYSTAELQKEIVEAERQSGSRWIGGGFGIGGALAGAAMAGTFNMIGNAGKSSSSMKRSDIDSKANDVIRKIFKNPDTLYNLAIGLEYDVSNYFICMIERISEEDDYEFDYIDTDESSQAEKIFKNISNPVIDEAQKRDMIVNKYL